MSYFIIAIWIFMVLLFAIFVTVIIVLKIMFKHKVRIIDLGKQGIELDFKAMDKVVDGVMYWILDKEKNKEFKRMPVPPALAIGLSKGGKKSVEAFRTETGEYIFINRYATTLDNPEIKDTLMNPPQDILDIQDSVIRSELLSKWRRAIIKKWEKEHSGKVIEAYEPFTTKQRMILMNNFTKANARKAFSWKDHVPVIVGLGTAAIVVLALLIFWGDIAKPALEARQIGVQEQTIQKETLEIIRDMQRGQQRIEAEQAQIKEQLKNNGGK